VIVDLYEAVDRMLWAIAAWIAAGAAVAAPVALFSGWVVTRVVKWAWRAARRAWGSTAPRGALGARLPASQPSSVPHGPDAPERASGPPCRHSHEQTGRKAA
jgi:hypothetical protein